MDLLLTHGYFLQEDAQERRLMKPYPPLGILYLSSHLKRAGFSVRLFDSTFQTFDAFRAWIARERPPIVGIACNLMTKRSVVRMIPVCRSHGALVVLGGPEPASYAEQYLDAGADVIVSGEGERTLEELLPLLTRKPAARDLGHVQGIVYRDERGAIVRTPPRPLIPVLDDQPFPDREAIDLETYLDTWRRHHGQASASLITARGCPYTCRWCSRSVFGETHRRRSVANVADEVEQIVDRYHPDMLWYADDVFTIHHGWILKYAAELERRRLRVPFECISRADRITPAIADALARLGCRRLWIGSESGSQRILDAMERGVTVGAVQDATQLLRGRGIQVGMFIMLGYAGEELQDLEATVDHLKRAAPDVFLTTVAYPIKGTPYYNEVRDEIDVPGKWSTRTDRDLRIRNRPGRAYYQFARRWMTAEVARDRYRRNGRRLRAARSAVSALVGRAGMALLSARPPTSESRLPNPESHRLP
ncbi:MAG: B12-binding domain-containing radical SAM protein [Acidobacteria bacterium]|nr:B12-binding domain-containing radical SAM protein [Acidobacteriota bacterium]